MSTAGQHHLPFEDRHTEPAAPDLAFPVLPRTALLARLDSAADSHHTILLSAPAGTGKTILLRTWLAHRRTAHPTARTAWITADCHPDLWTRLRHNLVRPNTGPGSQPPAPTTGHPRTELSAVPTPPPEITLGPRNTPPGDPKKRIPLHGNQFSASQLNTTAPHGSPTVEAGDRFPVDTSGSRTPVGTAATAGPVIMSAGATPVGTVTGANGAAGSTSGRAGVGAGALALCLAALSADSRPVVVVIDSAHKITDAEVLEELEEFVSAAPPNVTVVVAARFDPPVRWHALELRGALARFGIRELALTAAEVEELCAQHGCALEGVVLDRVMALTEGWAALVRLAAAQLAARPRIGRPR